MGFVNLNPPKIKPPVKESLMTIFRHDDEGPVLYTLHAFHVEKEDGPEPEPPVAVADADADAGALRTRRKTRPVTLLQLRRDEYPLGMGFVLLENSNTLYLVGGQFNNGGVIYSSKKVFSVNLTPLLLSSIPIYISDDGASKISISPTSPSSSMLSSPSASSSFGSSSSSGNGNLLSVDEAPRMHTGKCNPIVIAAHGQIYVLASGCEHNFYSPTKPASIYPNPNLLGPPPFDDPEDMTLVELHQPSDTIFEFFDPQTQTWTVLPPPPPEHYSTIFHPTIIHGHSVVKSMILFCNEFSNLLAYHIHNQQWAYFNPSFLPTGVRSNPSFDPYLLSPLVRDGIYGRGVVADNKTHYVYNLRLNSLSAQHIGQYDSTKPLFSVPVNGSKFDVIDDYAITGGLVIPGLHVVYLNQQKFCAVLCDYTRLPENPGDIHVKIFKVSEEKCRCCGISACNANVLDSYALEELKTQFGSLLYCFALDKISQPNGQSKDKDMIEAEDDAAPIKKRKLII